MTATAAVLRPPQRQADLQRVDLVRVTGQLAGPAVVRYSTGAMPRAWMVLQIDPPRGLPYRVVKDLGDDLTDHMHAEAQAATLRAGALVSACGKWLRLSADHGAAVLVLEECSSVMQHTPATTAEQIQESDPCKPTH